MSKQDNRFINLKNNGYLQARNAADSANVDLIRLNASNIIEFASTPQVGGSNLLTTAAAAGSFANNALSNLSTTAINSDLIPGVDNTRVLGSTSFRWNNIYAQNATVGQPTNQRILLQGTSVTSPSGSIPSRMGISSEIAGAAGVGLAIFSQSGPTSNGSGPLFFETGNITSGASVHDTGAIQIKTGNTAGTGPSGIVTIETGTVTSGTRGKIRLRDGTQGTIGQVWTQTATDGSGSWVASAAASQTPANVQKFTSGSGTYYKNYAFTITSGSATAGATYTNNGATFTVSQTVSGATLIYLSGTGAPTSSGTLTLSTGTGDATLTFTSVKAPSSARIRMVGGGGGGAAAHTTTATGGSGTATTFGGTIVANPGIGGLVNDTSPNGGTPSFGSLDGAVLVTASTGAAGTGCISNLSSNCGGMGGVSPFGGAGAGTGGTNIASGLSASANTGSGGGGASRPGSFFGGVGGGAGAYIEFILTNPSAAGYAYVIGTGGTGASASGTSGGNGGSGIIIVEEFF